MTKKKADYQKVTTRVSDDFVVGYEKWFKKYKKAFPWATKNAVQSQALEEIIKNNVRLPWEGK